MSEKKQRIAINLEGENAKKFDEIQKQLGIRNKTDVLRWLINWYHKEMRKK